MTRAPSAVLAVLLLCMPSANAARAPAARTLTAPPAKMVQWDSRDHPNPATYVVGPVRVTLSARGADDMRQVVVRLRARSGETFETSADQGLPSAWTDFGVGRVDPAAAPDQLVFTTYSGGAHCCTDIYLVERLGGRWRVIQVAASIDGGLGVFPRDLDGDGRPEFQLGDDRFLYAFASHAESLRPSVIKAVENGVVKDLSKSRRFARVYRADLAEARGYCRKDHNNGACAAYAAAAARLGELDRAWPVVLASYDRNSPWELPKACTTHPARGACPKDQEVTFKTFPEALRWFLGETGYAPPIPLR